MRCAVYRAARKRDKRKRLARDRDPTSRLRVLGTGQTDGQTDDGHQRVMPPPCGCGVGGGHNKTTDLLDDVESLPASR